MTVSVPGILLIVAILAFGLGAPLAFVQRRWAYASCGAGSLLFAAISVLAIVAGPIRTPTWVGPLGEPESLSLDALSGFFGFTASIVWIATSAFSVYYDDRGPPVLAASYAFTLASIALLLSADNFLLFLVGWELMTISAYVMILQAPGRRDRVVSAARVFLFFGEASTLLVALSIAGMFAASGSFAMIPVAPSAELSALIFVAGLIGFGLKMGVAPFHMSEWLPIAHSSAPSNASAVLSATLTLAGVYGIFRVVSLLPDLPSWCGAVALLIGAVSTLLGALFAAVSEHTKGLPAYSTIENNGLILVALGVALIARSEGLTDLYVFALFAAFYQALAHALAKTTLFLFAGQVEHSTGTFDLSALQGRAKQSSRAAFVGATAAALSLAAAPPLAGFVSEWMILEALFQSYRFSPAGLQLLGLLAGAVVAFAAGLALVAMVKFLGFSQLWRPRPAAARHRSPGMGPVLAGMAAVLVAIGVAAPWVLVFIAPSVSAQAGEAVTAPVSGLLAIPNGWSIVSGFPFGIVSPPAIPIGLLIGALVAVAYLAAGRRSGWRRVPVWMAGTPSGEVGETYTSFGFSTGVRVMLGSVLRTREVRAQRGGVAVAEVATPESYNVELEVVDVFKIFYDRLADAGLALTNALKVGLMNGRLGRYLGYILVVTLLVMVYAVFAY